MEATKKIELQVRYRGVSSDLTLPFFLGMVTALLSVVVFKDLNLFWWLVVNSTVFIENIGQVPIYVGFTIQSLCAIFLGGLIGFDREQKMKAAGIKTNMLICLGAMIYTSLSLVNLEGASGPADPNRVSAQIVSGIGFLGAGTIIQARGNIVGLTTAASIWVVAAVGFTIGIGYPLVAAIFTISILFVLRYCRLLVKFFESERHEKNYLAEIATRGDSKEAIIKFLGTHSNLETYSEEILDHDKDRRVLSINLMVNGRHVHFLESELSGLVRVQNVKFLEVRA